jgi:hypothetical protein
MPQMRSLDRRPSEPTLEQIRMKCQQIQANWRATGDKRLVPDPDPQSRDDFRGNRPD